MSASKLDAVYRSILITKFFTKGWGNPDNLKRIFEFRKVISDREKCLQLVPPDYPVTITKEEKRSDWHMFEGHFVTPLEPLLPGVVPECARLAHFQVMMPANWAESGYKPMCVHLAGTGDHYFWRRRNLMAKPLIKEGIGAIILENPFYGLRKPVDQVRSSLHNVSDIFVMGGCLILETLVLLHWCQRNGLGPLGVTGLSMGGHMASLAATNWPQPLVLVPCLSWSTASAVFTRGVMSNSINWELLENQFFSDGVYKEQLAKMVTVIDEPFLAGRTFAQRFSKHEQSVNSINLSTILNTISSTAKMFDITNPNSHLRCSMQGSMPTIHSNRYSAESRSVVVRTTETTKPEVDNLESLKTEKKISVNLLNKITSDRKFTLEPSEINELNELARESVCDSTKQNEVRQNTAVEANAPDVSERILSEGDVNRNVPVIRQEVPCSLMCPQQVTNTVGVPSETEQAKTSLHQNIASKLWSGFPFISKAPTEEKKRYREALQFMRGVMDECTHLGNFSIPYDTSLIIAVCAKHDAYVPRDDTCALEELWPGAEVRYVDAGHVSAYVLHQKLFRSCIVEAFERSKKKWKTQQKEPQ